MDANTKKLCDSIMPIYSMDVYIEWMREQTQGEFISKCVDWYKDQHDQLSEIYMGVAEAWAERGMSKKSFIDFCTEAYAIQTYHEFIDQLVAKEIAEMTKPFPYTKS